MVIKEISQIKYEISDRTLFEIEHLQIQVKDRIGLVGKNGTGKTSLLEILAGKKSPTSGSVTEDASVTLLPQLKDSTTTKSGGEITQKYIDNALAEKADLLLADEPTTNLDTEKIEKLESAFQRFQGAIIVVSHDRAFLNAICNIIWELDNGELNVYKGNYSDFIEQKDLKIRQQEAAYESYIQKKQQLENALERKEQKAQRATKKPKNVSNSEARLIGAKPYFAKKQKKLQQVASSIETRIDKLEKVEKVRELPQIKMDIPNQGSLLGRFIIRAENVPGKIGNRILWKSTDFHVKGGDKIALIGNNGSGKTTLIKKILNSDVGISISPAVTFAYFSQNLDILNTEKTILENVLRTSIQDETTVRTILARLHFYRDDVYKPVGVLSGGERVKVAFAKLFVSDTNMLILDEPTNFLDIDAVEALEDLLVSYEGTVLLVSHDRAFIEKIADRIFIIDDEELVTFEGSYKQFKTYEPQPQTDSNEQALLVIENKMTEILGKLSLSPTEELEQEFQELLRKKRELQSE
ncbi:Vga family ABC-F type ribosomal protection protein [Oceanobacillus sp. CAU 1775]